MVVLFILIIGVGAFLILLFLYSLLKIAHISDMCAGYDEQTLKNEESSLPHDVS